MSELEKLEQYQQKITELQYTINVLSWDLKISCPEKSQDNMIKLITNYENKLFELTTSSFYGDLLTDAINSEEFNLLEDAEKKYIYNQYKHYTQFIKVPIDFYTKYIELKNKTNVVWKKAKEENNYEMYKPYLKKIIEMTKKYYRYLDNINENLYDVMLNEYETGITCELIDKLFNELKTEIVPLILNQNNKLSTYKYEFTKEQLIDCGKFLLEYIGFDNKKGLIDIYPHGFTEKMNSNDIRIAIRHSNDPFDFVTTIIHEGGHAIFEQNIKPNLAFYENHCIDNLYALHESQSRFFENILGRNINFWIPIFDKVKEKLGIEMDVHTFANSLNISVPSLIRVEADELTYCMHIILRYEIEKDIFNNNLSVDELPKIWNKKMKEYLGIDVNCDSNGLLQDVHWSEGSFGYFPSYLLGTIYSGMFKEIIENDLGNIDELLINGKIKDITNYLIKNIYSNGGAYTSLEILNKLYKKELTSEPIIKYLKKKYKKQI